MTRSISLIQAAIWLYVLNVSETFDADWNIRDGNGALVSRRDVIEAILASLGLDPAKAKLGEDFEFFTWKAEFNATTGDVDSASYENALGRLTTLINVRMGRRREDNPHEQLNVVARSVGTQLARDYARSQDAEYGINTLVTVTPVWGSRGDIIGGRINNFLNLSASNRNTFCGVNFGESILMTSNYWSATAFNKLLGFLTGSNGPLQPGQNLSDLRGFVGSARGCGFTRERIIGRGDGRPIAE